MKKTLLILAAMVFAVTACEKNTYVDGNYSATYDNPDANGWKAFVEFTLTDDQISDVDYDEINTDDDLKSTDTEYHALMASMRDTDPSIFIPQIEAAIANTSILPNYDLIDAITGATGSSNNANELMEAALDAAIDGEPTVVIPQPDQK